MDSRKFKKRIQRRLYHACTSDCDSDSDIDGLGTSSLPLTETCMEYFQDSFPGSEGLGRLDMPMAATVTKRNQVSPCSVVLSMMYAKRLRQGNEKYLQSMSSSDVFFISMMMASKYLYDEGVDEEVYNDEWAASVGHDTEDVNRMEMDFLKEVDWHLFTRHEDFDNTLTAVERRLALREGVRRGWFTYTEMSVLLDWDPIYNMWNQVGVDCTKMVSLLSAMYVASLVSVMGSAAIAIQLSGPMASVTVAAVLSLHNAISTTRHALPLSTTIGVQYLLPPNNSLVDMSVESENLDMDATVATEVSLAFSSMPRDHVTSKNFQRKENADVERLWSENNWTNQMRDGDVKNERDRLEDKIEKDANLSKLKMKNVTSVISVWLFDSIISHVMSVFGASTIPTCIETLDTNSLQNGDDCFNLGRDTALDNKCKLCGNVVKRRKSQSEEGGSRSRKQRFIGSQTQTPGLATTHVSTYVDDNIVLSNGVGNNLGAVKCCETAATTTTTSSATIRNRRTGCDQQQCLTEHPILSNSCQHSSPDFNEHLQTNSAKTVKDFGTSDCVSSRHNLPPSPSPDVRDDSSNLDLILPLSLLMTEVPILEPVGFFTKNSSPANSYSLST